MKIRKLWISTACGCLLAVAANAQLTIENFEYASDGDLLAQWTPQAATLSLSPYVAPHSTGTNSLKIERNFPARTWETEIISGQPLAAPMSIATNQYITMRIAGDPQFTNATYQQLFLYAYDSDGNFGRWGAPVPTSTNWQIFNMRADTIAQPWDSTKLPDLSKISQFKFFLYGQGDPAGAEYPATLYVDDITVRDSALIEFPPPSPMRSLIDDFETYADTAALMGFYGYVNSPAATTTEASLESPAPQGNKALKMTINFAPGQWPWGSVRSPELAPFSVPTNAVVTMRVKGDTALLAVADGGTVFYLTFYDQAGRAFNYTTTAAVTNSSWTTLRAPYTSFWTSTPVDTGNLVRWRLLVEGWKGTTETPSMAGTFYVDDVRVTVPPVLSLTKDAGTWTLHMDSLIPGTTYTLGQSSDLSQWTTSTVQSTSASQTMTITPSGQKTFYRLSYTP